MGSERERQITFGPRNHILTNCNVWSPDSQHIVYDLRSDAEGSVFDGDRIEIVNVYSGDVRCVYESRSGAKCGVATFDPTSSRVVFILGPENPTDDWHYGPAHRQGVIVDINRPDVRTNLDARDLSPPRTPGALRGGSHMHLFSFDGQWVSFTYNDALISRFSVETDGNDTDQRNVGISVPAANGVAPPMDNARNANGSFFTVLVTRTTGRPAAGSDEITQALEQGWVGANGYARSDGTRQHRALAFLGTVLTAEGTSISEVFVVDIPEDVTVPSPDGPLEGTSSKRPLPPLGAEQRRLTFTAARKFSGIQGPRHWLQSSPDGSKIAFLMRDDTGVVQIWTVSPNGGEPRQVTTDRWSIASAFTWSPDGLEIAFVADNSVFVAAVDSGNSRRLTERSTDDAAPRPLACVYSPDGRKIAYLRRVRDGDSDERRNQIFVADLGSGVSAV